MALFYVTGLSGTGKSAVRSELEARGYEAAYRRFGAVIIDAARPLDQVVDEILDVCLGPGGQVGTVGAVGA